MAEHAIMFRERPRGPVQLWGYVDEGFRHRRLGEGWLRGRAAWLASARGLLAELREEGFARAQVFVDGRRVRRERCKPPASSLTPERRVDDVDTAAGASVPVCRLRPGLAGGDAEVGG